MCMRCKRVLACVFKPTRMRDTGMRVCATTTVLVVGVHGVDCYDTEPLLNILSP